MDTLRWEPGSDLAKTVKEISKVIANSGSAEAMIVASDEVLNPLGPYLRGYDSGSRIHYCCYSAGPAVSKQPRH
jgi:hypothetical protein